MMNTSLLVTNIGFGTSFLILIFLGFFVLFRGERKPVHITFFIFSMSIAVWTLVFIFGTNISDNKLSYIIWKFNTVVTLIGASYIHWIFVITNKAKEMKNVIITIYTVAAGIVISSLLFPKHFLGGVEPKLYFNNYGTDPGIIYNAMFVYFVSLGIFSLYFVLKVIASEKNSKIRNRLKYVAAGAIFGWVVGPVAFPLVWNVPLDPVLAMFIGFYNIIFAYAIFKHDLMDIKSVIKKAFIYSVILAIISGVLIAVSLLNTWFIKHIPGFQFWTVPLLASVVALIIGNIFWRKSQEADRLKYEFISVASHKLRTPLTYIRWEISNIIESSKGKLSVKTEASLDKINEASMRLIKISDILLEASSQEADSSYYNFDEMDIKESVEKIINEFRSLISQKKISLSVKIDDDVSKVYADIKQIETVVNGLIENAVMYTPDGGNILIYLRNKKHNNIMFSIEDSGIGLTKREKAQIFSKFFRSHKALLTDTEGLGLALFLAKGIIDKHKGKMGVTSKGLGKGSVFWFTLKAIK